MLLVIALPCVCGWGGGGGAGQGDFPPGTSTQRKGRGILLGFKGTGVGAGQASKNDRSFLAGGWKLLTGSDVESYAAWVGAHSVADRSGSACWFWPGLVQDVVWVERTVYEGDGWMRPCHRVGGVASRVIRLWTVSAVG